MKSNRINLFITFFLLLFFLISCGGSSNNHPKNKKANDAAGGGTSGGGSADGGTSGEGSSGGHYINTCSSSDSSAGVFISYATPDYVRTLDTFVKSNKLAGLLAWEVRGDLPHDNPKSIFKAIKETHQKYTMAYWINSSIYNQGNAMPIDAIPFPGSFDTDGKTKLESPEFKALIDGNYFTHLTYAFMEMQPSGAKKPGALYFFDPNADIKKDSPICTNSATKYICTYTDTPAVRGNFDAFNAYTTTIKKFVSLGGYGHDQAFEIMFNGTGGVNDSYVANFTKSVTELLASYTNINGIDLDYENPYMTLNQSKSFAAVIDKLHTALKGKNIDIITTILANPNYIKGEDGVGFDKAAITSIALNSDKINLMTYDFHGAFDYKADGTGKTGFLSNVVDPSNTAQTSDNIFSVQRTLDAIKSVGIDTSKIAVGIPIYGRALSNISGTNCGLFQTISASKTGMPRGNLDQNNCVQTIPLAEANACSGSFTYNYIVNNLLTGGFTESQWQSQYNGVKVNNGTTAFSATWKPPISPDYKLQITNTDAIVGINYVRIYNSAEKEVFNSGYLDKSDDITFTKTSNPSISNILFAGDVTLTVKWQATSPNAVNTCSTTFKMKSNFHIMINATTKVCEITAMN